MIKEMLSNLKQLLKRFFEVRIMKHEKIFQYTFEATLSLDDPSYVRRKADDELFENLKSGKLCYVFNSRKMGKSSLEVRVRKKLEEEGFICASIDISGNGSESVTLSRWYYGIIKQLAQEFELDIGKDNNSLTLWWNQRENQAYTNTLGDFLEELLKVFNNKILIVIDEIDSVHNLKFAVNDFFAFLRWCYNNRVKNSEYERLVFCLLGVATPSDLISDPTVTPFNIGQAIELSGFTFEEAKEGLLQGLRENVDKSDQVLQDILEWTNGQPFLTQKLCHLVVNQRKKNPNIKKIVQTKIITNWEDNDNPEYLKRIRNHILHRDDYIGKRLTLYQQILQQEQGIVVDNSREEEQLRLSGIVIRSQGRLSVCNKICRTIFNLDWVQKQLDNLRPYPKDYVSNWEASNRKDQSWLLRGTALQDALQWRERMGARLNEFPLDSSFINASQVAEQVAEAVSQGKAEIELKAVLLSMMERLLGKTSNLEIITTEILAWTNRELLLTKMICESLKSESVILEGTEKQWVQEWMQRNIIDKWENSLIAENLKKIRDCLLDEKRSFWRLESYQQILTLKNTEAIEENDLNSLLVSGLVVKDEEGKLRVANRIYEKIFNQQWIENNLPPYAKAFKAWETSAGCNESLLLQEQDLQQALDWVQNKKQLNELEIEFIITSLVWEMWKDASNPEIQKAKTEAVEIVKKIRPKLKEKTNTPDSLIREILKWNKLQPFLVENILKFICDSRSDISVVDITKNIVRLIIQDELAIQNEDKAKKLLENKQKFESDEFREFLRISCDTIKGGVNKTPQWIIRHSLNRMFSEAKSIMGQKQLDELLTNIVTEARGDLESILIFDLSEGLPLYHNKQLKSSKPELYHALFGDGEDGSGGEAIKGFNALNKIQDALNNFGEKTEFGALTYSIFKLNEGTMMVYFVQLDIPVAICFIAPNEINLGNVVRQSKRRINDIKNELKGI